MRAILTTVLTLSSFSLFASTTCEYKVLDIKGCQITTPVQGVVELKEIKGKRQTGSYFTLNYEGVSHFVKLVSGDRESRTYGSYFSNSRSLDIPSIRKGDERGVFIDLFGSDFTEKEGIAPSNSCGTFNEYPTLNIVCH